MCAHIKAASDNAEKVAATALLAFVSALRSSRASADPATASAPPAAGASVSSLLVPILPPPVKKAPKGNAKDSESADSAKPTKDRDASAKGSSSGRNNRTGPPGKGPSGTGRARSVAPPSRGRGRGVGREGGNLNRSQSHTPSGSGSHQHFSLASLGATLSHPWEPLKRTVNVGGRTVGVLQGAAIGALSLLLGASAGTQGLTEKAATATRFCARVATSASSSHLVLQVALPSTISPALRHGIARYGLRSSQMGREGLPGRESREPPEEVGVGDIVHALEVAGVDQQLQRIGRGRRSLLVLAQSLIDRARDLERRVLLCACSAPTAAPRRGPPSEPPTSTGSADVTVTAANCTCALGRVVCIAHHPSGMLWRYPSPSGCPCTKPSQAMPRMVLLSPQPQPQPQPQPPTQAWSPTCMYMLPWVRALVYPLSQSWGDSVLGFKGRWVSYCLRPSPLRHQGQGIEQLMNSWPSFPRL